MREIQYQVNWKNVDSVREAGRCILAGESFKLIFTKQQQIKKLKRFIFPKLDAGFENNSFMLLTFYPSWVVSFTSGLLVLAGTGEFLDSSDYNVGYKVSDLHSYAEILFYNVR